MNNTILYPGAFDPITNGHSDLIARAAGIFDQVIVAIADNPQKTTTFSLQERISLAEQVLHDYSNVEVKGFKGLLVNFARDCNANLILRGLRAVSDFEYEIQLAGMNRHLAPGIETVFMSPSAQHTYTSSTLVREIANLGGDVTQFVHPVVTKALQKL